MLICNGIKAITCLYAFHAYHHYIVSLCLSELPVQMLCSYACHFVGLEAERQRDFGEFLLRVGDGKEPTFAEVGEDYIQLPSDMLENSQQRKGLIDWVYHDLLQHHRDPSYFAKRAVLSLKNSDVDALNDIVLDMFPGEVSL